MLSTLTKFLLNVSVRFSLTEQEVGNYPTCVDIPAKACGAKMLALVQP